jgi:hypothetical protein
MSLPKHHPTYAIKIYKYRIIIELIQRCLSKKNGEQMYQYLVICRDKTYFVKSYSKSNNKYKQDEIIQMLDFVNRQHMCIPMGTNCAPPLADLFLYAYEADFLQELLKNKDRKLAQTFNSSFRYIDDVSSLNNY